MLFLIFKVPPLTPLPSVVRNGPEWYRHSQYNHKVGLVFIKDMHITDINQYDIHLCAYTAMVRIVSAFHAEVFSDPTTPSGLNKVRFYHSCLLFDTNSVAEHRLPICHARP